MTRAEMARHARAVRGQRRQGCPRSSPKTLKKRGDYLKSHIVQALALESAEAYAEWLHSQIRKIWGFPDAPDMTMMQRFQAKYHGKRYSFGYPACPRLDDQACSSGFCEAGGNRRAADRGLHDGSGGQRFGARLPPPAGVLLFRRNQER